MSDFTRQRTKTWRFIVPILFVLCAQGLSDLFKAYEARAFSEG